MRSVFLLGILAISLFVSLGLVGRAPDYWPTDGWREAFPEDMGMDSEILENMFGWIEEKGHNIEGVVIVRYGYIVEEGYLTDGKVRAVSEDYTEEMHDLYSVTKSVTALLVGIAIDEGYLELSQTLYDFFPEKWDPSYDSRKKTITIQHLLTMTSGLEWLEGFEGYSSYFSSSDYIQYTLDLPLTSDPGETFNYNTPASHLLSAIVEDVTGQKMSEFAQERLFEPLGISEAYLDWDEDPQGITTGGWGLSLTPRDMAKIGLLCLNNGTWDGEQIVDSGWIETATTPNLGGSDYGYLFWLFEGGYTCAGLYGQHIFVIPEHDLVAAFTANLWMETSQVTQIYDHLMENFVVGAVVHVLLGDLNTDGIVDIFDAVLLSIAFGSSLEDPEWNRSADLNDDDIIDIFDVVLFAQNFGKTE